MSDRIADNPTRLTHREEIAFFNDLIIDLKKRVLGHAPRQPIDMDRLMEATAQLGKLEKCKERVRFL